MRGIAEPAERSLAARRSARVPAPRSSGAALGPPLEASPRTEAEELPALGDASDQTETVLEHQELDARDLEAGVHQRAVALIELLPTPGGEVPEPVPRPVPVTDELVHARLRRQDEGEHHHAHRHPLQVGGGDDARDLPALHHEQERPGAEELQHVREPEVRGDEVGGVDGVGPGRRLPSAIPRIARRGCSLRPSTRMRADRGGPGRRPDSPGQHLEVLGRDPNQAGAEVLAPGFLPLDE